MIETRPNTTFEALLEGGDEGWLGQLTVKILSIDNQTVITPATSVGIRETDAGVYSALMVAPGQPDSYLIVWEFPPGDDQNTFTEELEVVEFVLTAELPAWTPSLQAVADMVPNRTRTKGGHFLGVFSSDTDPTADLVSRYITHGVSRIAGRTGSTVMPNLALAGEANELAAIYAAMRIELGHYSEQITTNRSAYLELKKLWDAGLAAIGLKFDEQTTTDPTGGTLSNMGSFSFPPTEIGDGQLP